MLLQKFLLLKKSTKLKKKLSKFEPQKTKSFGAFFMHKTENIKLTLYIDGWCPMCKRFAKKIALFDRKQQIAIKDIRIVSHPNIDLEKAVKALASIDQKGNVYYGFDTIHQLCFTLPFLLVVTPITYFLKISRIGHFLYNELAVRRTIIPLHCNEDNCIRIEPKS